MGLVIRISEMVRRHPRSDGVGEEWCAMTCSLDVD